MYNCAKCFQRGCTKQDMTKTLPECPSKDTAVQEQAKELYRDPENYRIAYCAALTEAGGYCKDTRMIEIIKFLHRAGYKKIGLAFCTGLFKEAQEVVKILEYNGFEVVSIICKNGAITKDFLGITDAQAVRGNCKTESMCNPIGQALVQDIVQICRTHHMNCVAEGVENQEQLDTLLEMGCPYAQGFYYDRPLPAQVFEAHYLQHKTAPGQDRASKEERI